MGTRRRGPFFCLLGLPVIGDKLEGRGRNQTQRGTTAFASMKKCSRTREACVCVIKVNTSSQKKTKNQKNKIERACVFVFMGVCVFFSLVEATGDKVLMKYMKGNCCIQLRDTPWGTADHRAHKFTPTPFSFAAGRRKTAHTHTHTWELKTSSEGLKWDGRTAHITLSLCQK